jgi:hypothetical protein
VCKQIGYWDVPSITDYYAYRVDTDGVLWGARCFSPKTADWNQITYRELKGKMEIKTRHWTDADDRKAAEKEKEKRKTAAERRGGERNAGESQAHIESKDLFGLRKLAQETRRVEMFWNGTKNADCYIIKGND